MIAGRFRLFLAGIPGPIRLIFAPITAVAYLMAWAIGQAETTSDRIAYTILCSLFFMGAAILWGAIVIGLIDIGQTALGSSAPPFVLSPAPARPAAGQARTGGMPVIRADAIVLGAGIGGASTALHLRRRGLSVLLLERDLAGQRASGVNFGGVRQQGRALGVPGASGPSCPGSSAPMASSRSPVISASRAARPTWR
jgi:hypothetical protein